MKVGVLNCIFQSRLLSNTLRHGHISCQVVGLLFFFSPASIGQTINEDLMEEEAPGQEQGQCQGHFGAHWCLCPILAWSCKRGFLLSNC